MPVLILTSATVRLGDLQLRHLHLRQVCGREALSHIQHLEAADAAVDVKIEDDPRTNLFRFDYLRFIETDLEGVGLLIDSHPHGLRPLLVALPSLPKKGGRGRPFRFGMKIEYHVE